MRSYPPMLVTSCAYLQSKGGGKDLLRVGRECVSERTAVFVVQEPQEHAREGAVEQLAQEEIDRLRGELECEFQDWMSEGTAKL